MSLAALNHPNIVTIHDFDEADGVLFLVLEWIEGKSLADLVVKRPISIEEFNRIIPGARLVMLPAGGHYFPTDTEVVMKVVGAINRFMEEGKREECLGR